MKKLCALLLCMTMILSLVPAVHAATNVTLVEDFDNYAVGQKLGRSFMMANSEVFGGNFYEQNSTIVVSPDGYKGNCMKITTSSEGSWHQLGTVGTTPTEDAPVYYNFKLRIDDDVNGTANLPIMLDYAKLIYIQQSSGQGVLWPHIPTGAQGYLARQPYEIGKWYDVRIKHTPSIIEARIESPEGVVSTGCNTADASKYNRISFKGAGSSGAALIGGATMSIDEFYIVQGDGKDEMNFLSSDIGKTSAPSTYNKTVVVHEDFNGMQFPNTINAVAIYMVRSGNFEGSINDNGTGSNNIAMYSNLAGTGNLVYSSVPDGKGGYALKLHPQTGGPSKFSSKGVTYETGKAFTSVRVKMDETLTNKEAVFFMGMGNVGDCGNEMLIRYGQFESWYYFGRNLEAHTLYNPEEWYTIVMEYEKIDGVNTTHFHLYDKNDNLVRTWTPHPSNSSGLHRAINDTARLSMAINSNPNGKTLTIDDVMVVHTNDDVDSQAFIKAEILDASRVVPTTPCVKVAFDQIVGEGSAAKFVSGTQEIPAAIKYTGSQIVEITPVEALDDSKTYSLDLSGIRGVDGQGLASSSTSVLHGITTRPYSIGEMTLGELAVSGTTLTVPVTFANSTYSELNTKLIAALYDSTGNLLWVDYKFIKDDLVGEKTYTFTGLPKNADVSKIKIFSWDDFSTIRPLYN